jgi:hypothetical protein
LFFEDGLRLPAERGAIIPEAFRHPKITIGAKRCGKACFLFILFAEPDLIVPREII